MAGRSTKPWVAPRGCKPTHAFVSPSGVPGRHVVCLPSVARRNRHGGVVDAALARSSDQPSLAAVASVQRSSSARSAWILR